MLIFQKKEKYIQNSLKKLKTHVFADATHLTQASRTKLLRALGSSLKGVKVGAIALKVPLEVALEHNSKRTGRANVPEDVIKGMYRDYTIPTIEEGFDVVYQAIYNKEIDKFTYATEFKDVYEFYAGNEV